MRVAGLDQELRRCSVGAIPARDGGRRRAAGRRAGGGLAGGALGAGVPVGRARRPRRRGGTEGRLHLRPRPARLLAARSLPSAPGAGAGLGGRRLVGPSPLQARTRAARADHRRGPRAGVPRGSQSGRVPVLASSGPRRNGSDRAAAARPRTPPSRGNRAARRAVRVARVGAPRGRRRLGAALPRDRDRRRGAPPAAWR